MLTITFDKFIPKECRTPAAILQYLAQNQIPLINVQHLFPETFNSICRSDEFREELKKHSLRYNHWNLHYTELFNTLQRYGIEIVLIKATDLAPSLSYTSGNIDALVRQGHLNQVRQILFDNRYVELKNIEEPHKFLFKKFIGSNAAVELHVHTQVGWGVCFIGDEIWNNRMSVSSDNKAVLLLSSEDQFLVHIGHTFYENKKLNLLDLIRLVDSFRQVKNWDYVTHIPKKYGWYDGFEYILLQYANLMQGADDSLKENSILKKYTLDAASSHRQNDLILPSKINFAFSKYLYYKKVWMDSTTTMSKKIYETIATLLWAVELKAHIKSQNAMLVVISGIDGSGKTTQAKLLREILRKCDLKTTYVWKRAASSKFTDIIIKAGKYLLLSGSKKSSSHDNTNQTVVVKKNYLSNLFVRFFWKWIILIELSFYFLFKVTIPLSFGRIVICDRYIDDAIAELSVMYRRNVFDTWYAKVLRFVNPTPDFTVFISIKAETAMQRTSISEGETFLNEISLCYQKNSRESSYLIIDGNESPSDIATKVAFTLVRRYYEGYKPLGKILLLASSRQLNGD